MRKLAEASEKERKTYKKLSADETRHKLTDKAKVEFSFRQVFWYHFDGKIFKVKDNIVEQSLVRVSLPVSPWKCLQTISFSFISLFALADNLLLFSAGAKFPNLITYFHIFFAFHFSPFSHPHAYPQSQRKKEKLLLSAAKLKHAKSCSPWFVRNLSELWASSVELNGRCLLPKHSFGKRYWLASRHFSRQAFNRKASYSMPNSSSC